MIQWMHRLSKSWAATLLMGVLTLSFVVWGIADVFTGSSSTAVATVGGAEIDGQDFQREYRNFVRNQGQQMGTEITPEMAQQMRLGETELQRMVSRTAMNNEAARLGLTTTDAEVAGNVRSMAQFRGPLGQFDRPTFLQLVQTAGYSEDQFLEEVRQEMTRDQLTNAVESNFLLPPGYAQALFLYINERRAVDYVLLTPEAAGDVTPPSDAVLTAYVKAHAARFSTPEYREGDYAAITPADVMGSITVTDAQIKQDYDAHKDTYVVPEKRDIQQIEFKTEAEAKDARAKIPGVSFEALAAARGVKPDQLTLGTLALSDLPDADRAKAIFALPVNEVSAPIKTALGGYVLARVTKITPGNTRTLDQAKDEIRKNLQTQLAANKLVDIVNAFTDARGGGDDLAAAAKKAGLHTAHLAPVDAGGMKPDGTKAEVPPDPEFLPALFKAEVGEDNDPFPTKLGSYYVIKVGGVTPPKLKPLEQVRADALAAWTAQQRTTIVAAKAKILAAQAATDKSLDNIAKALKVSVQHSPSLARNTNDTMFSAAMTQQVFDTAPGNVTYGPQGLSGNYLIARLSGVAHPQFKPNDPGFANGAARLSQTVAADFSIALANAARARQGVKVNRQLLQSVIGGG